MNKKTITFSISLLIVFMLIFGVSISSSAKEFITVLGNNITNQTKSMIDDFLNNSNISSEDKKNLIDIYEKLPALFDTETNLKLANSELNDIEMSCWIVIEYLKSITDYTVAEQHTFGVDGSNQDNIILWDASEDSNVLILPNEVIQALVDIKNSFNKSGYYFDTIRVKNGEFCFDTIDGQYALICVIDKSSTVNTRSEDMFVYYKAKDNWYHRFSR